MIVKREVQELRSTDYLQPCATMCHLFLVQQNKQMFTSKAREKFGVKVMNLRESAERRPRKLTIDVTPKKNLIDFCWKNELNGIKVRVFFGRNIEKNTCDVFIKIIVVFVNQTFL